MRQVVELRRAPAIQLLAVCASVKVTVPLMAAHAECGFPSAADDYLDRPLECNDLLIENPPATFAARVSGESMTSIGIFPGDIAVVNRARRVVDKAIVLAVVDGEFTLKRYRKRGGRVWLQPENAAFKDIEILDGMAFDVWGVLTHTIRMLK